MSFGMMVTRLRGWHRLLFEKSHQYASRPPGGPDGGRLNRRSDLKSRAPPDQALERQLADQSSVLFW